MHPKKNELNFAALLKLAKQMSADTFRQKYKDPVFVAMGVLEAEEIRAHRGSTTEVQVVKPAVHNPLKRHPLAGRVFVIPVSSKPSGSLIFGREKPADILVPDETVSVLHCVVQWDDNEVSITDAGSTNGTQVNLHPLRPQRPVELLNEDIVTIGPHSFQFFLPLPFHQVLCGLGRPPV